MRLDATSLWLLMLVIGAGTFLIRFSFIWLFGRGEISPGVQGILRFIPPSVLSAMILPSFVFPHHSGFAIGNPRMWAGALAAIVAWRTKSMILTILTGMSALWMMTLL